MSVGRRRFLAALAFSEAIFFPIPVDVFLATLLGAQEEPQWVRYAAITTFWSALGGIGGFLIGYFLYTSVGVFLVHLYHVEKYVETVRALYAANVFWATFAAGFTFIPYKVFTLAAGFFRVSLPIFFAASVISRGLRFFLVAYLMKRFGGRVARFAFRYFNVAFATALVLLVVYLFVQ